MKLILFISTIFFFPVMLFGQIENTTLTFKDILIEYYKYKLENDTITIIYFDRSVRTTIQSIQTNTGIIKTDATFDSIAEFVKKEFPNERPSVFRTDTKIVLTNFNNNVAPPTETFGKAHNHFWIGAINYYSEMLKSGKPSDSNYYNIANSLIQYHGSTNPWGINERVISYLDSCISLNKFFKEAYLLKAKIHVQNAIWKGKLSADPQIDVIDPTELNKATSTLKALLQIDKNNKESIDVINEIGELKKKYYWYKYD